VAWARQSTDEGHETVLGDSWPQGSQERVMRCSLRIAAARPGPDPGQPDLARVPAAWEAGGVRGPRAPSPEGRPALPLRGGARAWRWGVRNLSARPWPGGTA